jgi:Mrp family chromosome partitioning ATPase
MLNTISSLVSQAIDSPDTSSAVTPSNVLSGNIMAGASWNSTNTALQDALTQATGQQTQNFAVPGSTTSDTLKQLNDFIGGGGSFGADTTVFLQAGGVDFLNGVDKGTIKDNLNSIVSTLGSQGVKVVLTGSPYATSIADVQNNNFNPEVDSLYKDVASANKNVALVDADIYGPSVAHLLDLKDKPELKNNLLQPILKYGLKIISIANLVDANQAGIWRGPMVTKILYQLIRAVNWQADNKKVEVMIIDMPPGTGDVYLSMAEKFPIAGVVLVSTPQSIAVIDVVKSIDCFRKLNVPILGLIQNMSYLKINNESEFLIGIKSTSKFSLYS